MSLSLLYNIEENKKSDRFFQYSLHKEYHFIFSLCKNYNLCYTYCQLHFPCTSSMMYQDIKLVFNKYNAIYKLLIWNSKFENLKLYESIGSFHSSALTVPTFETRRSIKSSVSIVLQVQKRKNIKRKTENF